MVVLLVPDICAYKFLLISTCIFQAIYMNELILLKIEARKLLDQVNQRVETSPNGKRAISSPWDAENLYHEVSFKEQVKSIRKKFYSLYSQNNFHD